MNNYLYEIHYSFVGKYEVIKKKFSCQAEDAERAIQVYRRMMYDKFSKEIVIKTITYEGILVGVESSKSFTVSNYYKEGVGDLRNGY